MSKRERINLGDLFLIGILLCLSVGAWIQMGQKTSNRDLKGRQSLGKILHVNGGTGKHLHSSDFFWTEANSGQEIGMNDSFMTGPETTAEIQVGENRIILKPNTLIKFVREDVVRFNDGEIIVTGEEIKIKTISAVHKVTGEATISTFEEKDKVSVTQGMHTIVPDSEIEDESIAADEGISHPKVQEGPSPLPPRPENYFLDLDWLKSKGLSKTIFVNGETLTLKEWISRVKAEQLLNDRIFVDGSEIEALYFLPFLDFDKEFKVDENNTLTQRKRHNGKLFVNGKSFDARAINIVELRPRTNRISLSHLFQTREYEYYVDEEADEIIIKKTEYQFSHLNRPEQEQNHLLSQELADAEEEEEESTGEIKLEWEGKLKDNQIYGVTIQDESGEIIQQDFAEDSHYFWTPPSTGNFWLEISVKSTVTDKILRTSRSPIVVSKQVSEDSAEYYIFKIAIGSTLLNSSTTNGNEKVSVTGMGPAALRVGLQTKKYEVSYEASLFYADVSSASNDHFFNHRLLLNTSIGSIVPMFVYQNGKIIYSEQEEIRLKEDNKYLGGLGYFLKIKDLSIVPSVLYNFGNLKGTQLGLELTYLLSKQFTIGLRGEKNQQTTTDFTSSTSQFVLLIGTQF
jgi:hypothetical protein